jgi:hypothetical protein
MFEPQIEEFDMGQIEKALQLGDVDVLIPKEIDKVIENLANYENPIRANLPRRPGSGKAWYLVQRTPAADSKIGFYSPDTKSFTTGGKGAYAEKEYTYRTIGVNGEIMRTAILATKDQVDLKTEEIEQRILEFKNKEEWGLIWAQHQTLPADNYEFDGIDHLLPAARTIVMKADAVGGALTLAKMDELIDKCAPYKPAMLIMSLAARRQLNAALQPQQMFLDKIDVKGGFRVPSYLDIPIFTSSNVPDTLGLNADGVAAQRIVSTRTGTTTFTIVGDVTADYPVGATVDCDCGADGILSGTISGSVYSSPDTTVTCSGAAFTANMLTSIITGVTTTLFALNLDHLWVGERQKLTYEEIKLSSQYTSFDIFEDITAVMSNPLPHAKLTGVKIG